MHHQISSSRLGQRSSSIPRDDVTSQSVAVVIQGTPKAIPWTHLTPIKCGVDGMLAQNIHAKSVVCWPTSLGWMMGPWLLYGAYLNKAPIALFQAHPPSMRHFDLTEEHPVFRDRPQHPPSANLWKWQR